jgi:PAS domain S-box-containing protein
VLLVEDNPGDARLVRELIADHAPHAWELFWATSLADGLGRLDDGGIDALLLDLGLPDSNGIDTVTRASAHPSGVPIVVMSGLGDETVATRALQEGARGYLVKGTFDPETLALSVARAVEQQRLEEARARLAAIVECSDDAIVANTPDGTITSWNAGAERLYGYRSEEISGKPVSVLLPPAVRDDFAAILERVRRGERIEHFETVRVRKDGSLVDVSLTISPVRDDGGRIIGISTIGRDVTERKHADETLRAAIEAAEAANRELEGFSYSVSHDLRAPLRAIDGFSRILVEEHASALPQEARRYLKIIRENAQRMGQLVDDLLAFSRLGRQPLGKRHVSPAEIVRDAIEEVRAGEKDRTVELTIGELPDCQADPALLKQVFLNLLGNAFKFTRRCENASVEVGCRRDGGEDVYFVRDNGAGFDMRYADKLFGVFQRLHRQEDFEGTGVGLALVERIVRRHGGRVWAEGAPERGATFSFTLGSATNG